MTGTKYFIEVLESILSEYRKLSDKIYVLNKKSFEITSDATEQHFEPRELFINSLSKNIYSIYHCRNDNIRREHSPDISFVQMLTRANSTLLALDEGWRIDNIKRNNELKVCKNGLSLYVDVNDFFCNQKIKKNLIGSISIPKEFFNMSPGFYVANGTLPLKDNSEITRFYWNLRQEGGPLLIKQLTRQLNNNNIGFRLKILNNPMNFTRSDSAVLYINQIDYPVVKKTLLKVYKSVTAFVNTSTSIFAKTILPGLSVAEDISTYESFGQNRSKILAESLYNCVDSNNTIKVNLKKVLNYLVKENVNPIFPYLCTHSKDIFT